MTRLYKRRLPISLLFGFSAGFILAGCGLWYGMTYGLPLLTASMLIAPVLTAVFGFVLGLAVTSLVLYTVLSLCFKPAAKHSHLGNKEGKPSTHSEKMKRVKSAPTGLARLLGASPTRPKSTPLPEQDLEKQRQEQEQRARLERISKFQSELSELGKAIETILQPKQHLFPHLWIKWRNMRDNHLDLPTLESIFTHIQEGKTKHSNESDSLDVIGNKMRDYHARITTNKEYLQYKNDEMKRIAIAETEARHREDEAADERNRRSGYMLGVLRERDGSNIVPAFPSSNLS